MAQGGVDDRLATRDQVDADFLLLRTASDHDRVEMQLIGLERCMPVQVVGERLAQVGFDGGRQHDGLAQHVARRQRQHHLGCHGVDTEVAVGECCYRGAPAGSDGRRIARQRDGRRRPHDRTFAVHGRPPQRRVVAVEHEHGTHAPTLQRRARLARHQRIELRHPPRPRAGESRATSEFREAGPQRRQGQVTDGHRTCLCRRSIASRRRQRRSEAA